MNMSIKKRMALGAGAIATVAAVGTLVAGVTFGFFSATQTASGNNFTAGTVSLGSPVVTNCTVAHIVPGNSGDCTVVVTTAGSEPADVAIDVAVAPGPTEPVASVPQAYGYAPSVNVPAAGLFDDSANGLQVTLTDSSSTSYVLTGLNGATSSETNLLTADSVAPGTVETYTLHWSMAVNGGVDNNYQGASSTFTFDVHSVQAANQAADSTAPGSADSTIVWS